MRLDEAEKILNENGYELINEDLGYFINSICSIPFGGLLGPVIIFFIWILAASGISGIIYGTGIGIKNIFHSIFKHITKRNKQDKIIIDSFIEALESLKKKENKEKLAKLIFDKIDFINYCNNKYIKTLDQFLLRDEISISDEDKNAYKKYDNDDILDIQINIRKMMIIKFLKGMLPKNLKLDKDSISTLTSVIVQLGYYYDSHTDVKEFEDSLDFNSLIDIIVNNISHYDYKE